MLVVLKQRYFRPSIEANPRVQTRIKGTTVAAPPRKNRLELFVTVCHAVHGPLIQVRRFRRD